MNHPEHICRFNDAPQTCECYDAGFDQARAEERERVMGIIKEKRNELWKVYHEAQLWEKQKTMVKPFDDLLASLQDNPTDKE